MVDESFDTRLRELWDLSRQGAFDWSDLVGMWVYDPDRGRGVVSSLSDDRRQFRVRYAAIEVNYSAVQGPALERLRTNGSIVQKALEELRQQEQRQRELEAEQERNALIARKHRDRLLKAAAEEKALRQQAANNLCERVGTRRQYDVDAAGSLMVALQKVDDLAVVSDEDESILVEHREWEVLAKYFERVWYEQSNYGVVSKAGKYWRYAGYPEKTILLIDRVIELRPSSPQVRSWLTVQAAAFRDLDLSEEAIRLGHEALRLSRSLEDGRFSHNVLGAAYHDLGDFAKSEEHFALGGGAVKEGVRDRMGGVKRETAIESLIRENPEKYQGLHGKI